MNQILPSSQILVALAALFSVCRSFQLSPEAPEPDSVCISVATYEGPAWVDALISNAFKFSENSTKIAIHLDKKSVWDETDIARWQTDRIAVSEKSVIVHPFRGSLLWAHLLNAETMAKTWGDTCKFFVLQASNMMWVRAGMEEQVRQRQFSPLGQHEARLGGCPYEERFGQPEWTNFAAKMSAPRKLYGQGQPEGSFFPLKHVLDFKAMLDNYIAQDLHGQEELISDAKCYFENTWLQTYMVNFVDLPSYETYNADGMKALSHNHMHNQNGKDNDSIPFDEMEAVRAGAHGFESMYAVKRVNRNMSHPITQAILSLSRQ